MSKYLGSLLFFPFTSLIWACFSKLLFRQNTLRSQKMHCLGHFTWAPSPCFFSELVFIQCNCILMRGSYQMTKRLIWCCSYCRRKPPGQTIWLETWCPWSWYTGHQGQSWKTKRRERAEQPSCPLPAPPCAAPVALPWHPEVRHFDHLGLPHQAVPSSLQEKKVQRQKVSAERLS